MSLQFPEALTRDPKPLLGLRARSFPGGVKFDAVAGPKQRSAEVTHLCQQQHLYKNRPDNCQRSEALLSLGLFISVIFFFFFFAAPEKFVPIPQS